MEGLIVVVVRDKPYESSPEQLKAALLQDKLKAALVRKAKEKNK